MKTVSPKVLDKRSILYEIKTFLEKKREYKHFEDSYKFLFFKMYISIIYQILKNNGEFTRKKEILTHIFNDKYFKREVLKDFPGFGKLSLMEKVLFFSLKYRLLNLGTLRLCDILI
jgi:hypothetical protein